MGVPGVILAVRALNSCLLLVLELSEKRDLYLAKVHTLHSFASKSWSNRWTRTRLTRANYQLHNLVSWNRFACHRSSAIGVKDAWTIFCSQIEEVGAERKRKILIGRSETGRGAKKFIYMLPESLKQTTAPSTVEISSMNWLKQQLVI